MSDEQPVAPEPTAPVPPAMAPSGGIQQSILEPEPGPDSTATTLALIAALEKLRKSRVLTYRTSPHARIGEGIVAPLYDQLESIGDVEHLDLVLDTLGGNVEMPWRIVSLIREFCEKFSVLIPYRAASAGTLLALGADEIVMTRLAVLGPIDPSRGHPLLPMGSEGPMQATSVQDMRHAIKFIKQTGAEIVDDKFTYTPEAVAQLLVALFDKVHPLAIGALEQSYALAKLAGTRCLETHMRAPGDEDKIREIVNRLSDEYKSHGYQIPRREAKAIGLKVTRPGKRVENVLVALYRHFISQPVWPQQKASPGIPMKAHIAWLDSSDLNLRCEADFVSDQQGNLQPQGDGWVAY